MLLYPYNQTYRQTFQTKPLVSDILVPEIILNPGSCYTGEMPKIVKGLSSPGMVSRSAVNDVKALARLLIHT